MILNPFDPEYRNMPLWCTYGRCLPIPFLSIICCKIIWQCDASGMTPYIYAYNVEKVKFSDIGYRLDDWIKQNRGDGWDEMVSFFINQYEAIDNLRSFITPIKRY